MEKSVLGMESVTAINVNVMMVGKNLIAAAALARKAVLVSNSLGQCYQFL